MQEVVLMKKNRVVLNLEERKELEEFTNKGVHNVRLVNRAKIILALDISDERVPSEKTELADKLNISRQAIYDTVKDFLNAKNVKEFLKRKKRKTPPIEPKITGDVEAKIIALACGEVPEGRAKWTLELLANKTIELNILDSISQMSVCRLLKKRNLSLI